jgi:hypothetical protein
MSAGALLAIAAITYMAITGRRPRPRGYLIPLVLVTGAAGYPLGTRPPATPPPGWFDAVAMALHITGLLGFVVLGVFVVVLRDIGRTPVTTRHAMVAQRRLGIGLAFVVLAAAYSWSDAESVIVPVSAAVAAFLLFPLDRITLARTIAGLGPAGRRQALGAAITSGQARRLMPSLRKSLQEKVADGAITHTEASRKLHSHRAIAFPHAQGGITVEQ